MASEGNSLHKTTPSHDRVEEENTLHLNHADTIGETNNQPSNLPNKINETSTYDPHISYQGTEKVDDQVARLQEEISSLQKENETFYSRNRHLEEVYQQSQTHIKYLNDRIKDLQNDNSRLQENNKRILRDKEKIENEYRKHYDASNQGKRYWMEKVNEGQRKIEDTERRYKALLSESEREKEQIQERLTQYMKKVSESGRDKTSVFTTNAGPQPLILSKALRQLNVGDFQIVTSNIAKYLSSVLPNTSLKRQKASIKGTLALSIIRDDIANNSTTDSDEYATGIICAIYDSLRIIMPSEANIVPHIKEEVKNLFEKGRDLVIDIKATGGTLVYYAPNTPFSPDEHETTGDFEDSWVVLFTVFPAYKIEDKVMNKALVFTGPQEVFQIEEEGV